MTSEIDHGTPRHGPIRRGDGLDHPFAGIWWLIVLRGLAGVVFGLIALFAPGATVLSLLLILGVYLMVDGVFGLISAVMAGRRQERWGLLVAESLLNLLIGLIVIVAPDIGLTVFMLLLAAWAIVTGGLMIGTAMNHKRDGKAWLIGGGLISVLFGIVLAVAPIVGAVVLTWWLGVYALVFGGALMVFGFRLRTITAP
ncbi:MAG TPA: HdeD family acid-resistance protein [Dongiaceae bacterium]|jgi:uncharacterized membrane protein HdeD (DUF308 family)|nr:HdeD family acid-resistance protein [Dongiaceae bacterium]